ncbi:hypothetical protein HPP92_014025 [Vanilla planifolia]|uniref:Uncharacterized protein n=1 Tax=Vanilla planifolia TaxID=51239 RepID=A0A835USR3_VANPL|nr:hypothetical protein HPP92_014025 [Vanilla planifolia]
MTERKEKRRKQVPFLETLAFALSARNGIPPLLLLAPPLFNTQPPLHYTFSDPLHSLITYSISAYLYGQGCRHLLRWSGFD